VLLFAVCSWVKKLEYCLEINNPTSKLGYLLIVVGRPLSKANNLYMFS
jgi:hypothetical protein